MVNTVEKFLPITVLQKKILLEVLGYIKKEDGFLYSKKTNKPYFCPYTKTKTKFSNASIIPGSLIIINGTPLALSKYFSKVEND